MRTILSAIAFIAIGCSCHAAEAAGASAIPKEVQALAGTYTGKWTSFGLDERGQIVKRAVWTDKVVAEKPARDDRNRAYLTTQIQMTFEGGMIPPMTIEGKDGYYFRADGTVGDQFIETMGQENRLHQIGTNAWSFSASANSRELTQMGFPAGASAQHVFVKVKNMEAGQETHRITRVTTVGWKDRDGAERWLQFTSLEGFHRREKATSDNH
jgi:hypothetical protein